MKRRRVHLAFATTAVACALLAASQFVRLERAEDTNRAMAGAARADAAQANVGLLPEARFAQALALARAGDHDGAAKGYQAIIQGDRADLRPAARYNLGNLRLREAIRNGPGNAAQSLPLIELAKQSYRNALREAPNDWDARYNLERALWLAPEYVAEFAQEKSPERERALTTMQRDKIELP